MKVRRLTDAQSELVAANLDLVGSATGFVARGSRSRLADDIRSVGHEALVEAASRWTGTGSFRHYAPPVVVSRMRDWLRAEERHPDFQEYPEGLVGDSRPDESTELARLGKRAISLATSDPNTRTAEIMRRHYVDDEAFQDIAADMGISPGRISQIHSRAINRCRALMCE